MIPTRRDDVVEDYHGTPVADPYRWLEDASSPETTAWVTAQNARTRAELDAIPARARLKSRLTALWDYPKYSIPTRVGERYVFSKNDGLQNQAALYIQDTLDGEPRLLLDPNTFSADGTVALSGVSFSEDGLYMAWATSSGGSDWQTWRVRELASGRDLPETIEWTKFASVAWTPDSAGFFYNRLPTPGTVAEADQNNYSRVYWHTLNTPASDDRLIYERPDAKELLFSPNVTDDGRYLIISAHVGTDPRTRVYYQDLSACPAAPITPLLDDYDAKYDFIHNEDTRFFFLTDLNAPTGRIVGVEITRPAREHWNSLSGPDEATIEHVGYMQGRFVMVVTRDAHNEVWLARSDASIGFQIPLPAAGAVEALSVKPRQRELFLSFTSFLYPSTPFRYDFDTGELVALHTPAIDFDFGAYETTQLFATSKDSTRVPLFVTHKRGLALDGQNPTLLYAYGGFNISLTPAFRIHVLPLLEAGGVFAVANLRGGGEYGEEWHQAGMFERKQNVFDDFIAAAEHLIATGYTSTPKLAINGGSNGGLLVAACETQRPDLYGAVVCEVPVIDMLRYHRFTVGHFWTVEYGNAETNPEHFRFLYAYSPLHNIKPGTTYPPTLITSADTDDRVVPAHAKKFAATLQAAQAGDAPVLLRVETRAGHGHGKPTSKIIDERADVYAFLWRELGIATA
jgi:prolyl oligopeptidase